MLVNKFLLYILIFHKMHLSPAGLSYLDICKCWKCFRPFSSASPTGVWELHYSCSMAARPADTISPHHSRLCQNLWPEYWLTLASVLLPAAVWEDQGCLLCLHSGITCCYKKKGLDPSFEPTCIRYFIATKKIISVIKANKIWIFSLYRMQDAAWWPWPHQVTFTHKY